MRDAVIALALLWLFGSSSSASSPSLPSSAKPGDWTDADVEAFARAVEPTGVNPEHALHVYAAESGLNPAAKAKAAWGIPQVQEPLLRVLGWEGPPALFATLSVSEQAPWIGRILATQIREIGYVPASALELYTANFSPLAARERRWVIYSRDNPAEERFYTANAKLDRAGKGYITTGDLDRSLQRVAGNALLRRVISQLRRLRAGL